MKGESLEGPRLTKTGLYMDQNCTYEIHCNLRRSDGATRIKIQLYIYNLSVDLGFISFGKEKDEEAKVV